MLSPLEDQPVQEEGEPAEVVLFTLEHMSGVPSSFQGIPFSRMPEVAFSLTVFLCEPDSRVFLLTLTSLCVVPSFFIGTSFACRVAFSLTVFSCEFLLTVPLSEVPSLVSFEEDLEVVLLTLKHLSRLPSMLKRPNSCRFAFFGISRFPFMGGFCFSILHCLNLKQKNQKRTIDSKLKTLFGIFGQADHTTFYRTRWWQSIRRSCQFDWEGGAGQLVGKRTRLMTHA